MLFRSAVVAVYPKLTNQWRLAIGILILTISIFVANAVGLVGLIAQGYGALTWGYWVLFVIPVLTFGVRAILKNE